MAISDETRSSSELLRESQHHWAALTAFPATSGLAPEVQRVRATLSQTVSSRAGADDLCTSALAVLQARDFELDEGVREMEIEVLAAVHKNRESPTYRALFPKGLSAVLAMRGETEAREVRAVVGQLKERRRRAHVGRASTATSLRLNGGRPSTLPSETPY